jgi:hypothetical protein
VDGGSEWDDYYAHGKYVVSLLAETLKARNALTTLAGPRFDQQFIAWFVRRFPSPDSPKDAAFAESG